MAIFLILWKERFARECSSAGVWPDKSSGIPQVLYEPEETLCEKECHGALAE